MSRSPRGLARALGLLAAAIIVGACSSGPPALSDPKEIITAALRTLGTARSVHLEMTLSGTITANVSGGTGPGAAISLSGTTASADVDIAAGNAHVTFAAPAILGLTGDLIQIGTTSYLKTSLGPKLYQVQKAAAALPVNPTDSTGLIAAVGDFMSRAGVDPVKGDDVACGGTRCYSVKIDLTPDELTALGVDGPATSGLPIDLGDASLGITIRVERDTNRLAGLALTVALGDQGSLALDVAMSRWDQPVTVSPPPADQVTTGS